MTRKRQKLRAIQTKLEAHDSLTPDAVLELLADARALIKDSKTDPRTKSIMIKFLVDHDWLVQEYKNPAPQVVQHQFPTKIQLEVVSAK